MPAQNPASPATEEKKDEKKDEKTTKPTQGFSLEEDDEFEDFPAEGMLRREWGIERRWLTARCCIPL